MSTVAHLLANSFIVYPLTRQILTAEKRFPKLSTRKLLAFIFLLFIGFISAGFQIYETINSRNAFKIIGVSRAATDQEIRRAYKLGAVELHPDKNTDDPNADDKFLEFKEAYDQLLNGPYRRAYDRWGETGSKWVESGHSEFEIFVNSAVAMLLQYGMMIGATFLATFMSSETSARSVCFSILIMLFSLDAHLRFQEADNIVVPFAPWFALHQIAEVLRQSYYTVIAGVVAFQNLTYTDGTIENMRLLQELIAQQREMQLHLLHLDQSLNRSKQFRMEAENDATSNLPRNLKSKIKGNQLRTQPPRSRSAGIPRFVLLIGLYIFVQYFLK